MPERLIALFDDPDTAAAAVTSLGEHSVSGVRVVSPAAYPVVHLTGKPGPWRWLGWLAFIGGLSGLIFAIVLTVGTSLSIDMPVGGKPVVSWPPFGVIMFELTMLGAGVTNFVALIVLAALSRRKVSARARNAINGDHIAVVVPMNRPEERSALEADLTGATSVEVA